MERAGSVERAARPSGQKEADVETVAFPLEDGGQLLVRVRPEHDTDQASPGERVVTRGRGGVQSRLAEAGITFEAALDPIRTIAEGVLHRIAQLPRSPDKVRVEFGLELSARAGAILAEAGSTAQLHVSLTWKPKRPTPQEKPHTLTPR